MTNLNNEWTKKERDQFIKEMTESVINNGGEVGEIEPCEVLLQKYRTRITVLAGNIAELKERLVKYEAI